MMFKPTFHFQENSRATVLTNKLPAARSARQEVWPETPTFPPDRIAWLFRRPFACARIGRSLHSHQIYSVQVVEEEYVWSY